ncbi:Hypothetical predicted protein [Mytilus galloprovincialis]|uniref:Uncharacterized protein n=1 Tax=Mytilus galloprovincialis TaxID=29158 RepID=A0A8B6E6F2_MYTGA|nr:Hypothetical predicted protein [Mytilus galloprovincialis]
MEDRLLLHNYNERFAILSEADRDKLLSNKNAESTKAATKYAVKTFHDYCMAAANYQTIVPFDLLPDNALDQLLEKFYPSLRKQEWRKVCCPKLEVNTSRHSKIVTLELHCECLLYYTEPPRRREINIISGENFNRSKAMFEAVCIDLKKSGLGDVTHKPVINDEDMAKTKFIHMFKIGSLMKNNDCKHFIRFNRHFLCINAIFMDRATGEERQGA